MIITLTEKYDVNPEWSERQIKREQGEAWIEWLCHLLAVYKIHDKANAVEAAERMRTVVGDLEAIRIAMD